MTKIAYVFSGLGSDERVFKYLDFGADVEIRVIKWIQPIMTESIADYALRLCTQIDGEGAYYLGVSFGGLVAIEVAKHIPAKKIILISSVKAAKELPGFYSIAGKIGFYKLANVKLIQRDSKFVFNMYGVKSKEHKGLLMSIFRDLDPIFFKWAIKQMMLWKHIKSQGELVQIHGSNDNAFPFKNIVQADYVIQGGGHFMVFDHAENLSHIVQKELA
jgi:pimeloyl-ACP methyl ester carboxylesterase